MVATAQEADRSVNGGGPRPAYRGGAGSTRPARPSRSTRQNRLLHALLSDIADQLPWPKATGELHSQEWWKRRCTLQWMIDKKMPFEIITPLYDHGNGEEEFGLLLPHTSDLNTAQCAELSEWILGFGAQHGISFEKMEAA